MTLMFACAPDHELTLTVSGPHIEDRKSALKVRDFTVLIQELGKPNISLDLTPNDILRYPYLDDDRVVMVIRVNQAMIDALHVTVHTPHPMAAGRSGKWVGTPQNPAAFEASGPPSTSQPSPQSRGV